MVWLRVRLLNVFLATYEHTSDPRYIELARKSLYGIGVPLEEGGILIEEGENEWWYEKIAHPDSKRSYVLNGHMFTLISLYKYLEYDNDDEKIKQLFENGLLALKKDAGEYDNGINDSFYDRVGNPANKYHPTHIKLANKYHPTHIKLFQKLFDITGDDELLKLKNQFEN